MCHFQGASFSYFLARLALPPCTTLEVASTSFCKELDAERSAIFSFQVGRTRLQCLLFELEDQDSYAAILRRVLQKPFVDTQRHKSDLRQEREKTVLFSSLGPTEVRKRYTGTYWISVNWMHRLSFQVSTSKSDFSFPVLTTTLATSRPLAFAHKKPGLVRKNNRREFIDACKACASQQTCSILGGPEVGHVCS